MECFVVVVELGADKYVSKNNTQELSAEILIARHT
jgi:hypothetical protein